jgi:hypothetical protein
MLKKRARYQSSRSKLALIAAATVAAATVLIAALVLIPRLLPHQEIHYAGITVEYPYTGCLFPADIVAPTFKWRDINLFADLWKITIAFEDGQAPLEYRIDEKQWRPTKEAWETIKKRSIEKRVTVTIRGFISEKPKTAVSEGTVEFGTSKDPVAAPIFYREVNLPFAEAVKDPTNIQWRFGTVASDDPPRIVLKKLPVCGNCHSFSKDGGTMGLEVDSGNDKGAYAVLPIVQDILLDRTKIISWSSYKKEEKDPTFGLLCQVSPDGRYVAGTVKDQALAVYRPDLMFSQLFFLIKGIIAIYDRQNKTFTALPGADDRRFVQTNATWSPDGSYLVYPRSKAYDIEAIRRLHTALVGGPLAEAFIANQGKTYKYDLYKIPFNGGKGGTPEPLAGASNNGMSNYFAKYSPDGKWIVFCKANNYMLLQPDSKLYIVPSQGGEARELACNTATMNSWHSFSPNGRWLVFSSKVNGPYTKLFLAHLDDNGNSAPPVALENFTSADRAANIPEFVNTGSDALVKIEADYLDAYSYYRIANTFHTCGDFDRAIPAYRVALKYNPKDYHAHNNLGVLLYGKGKREEAVREFNAANDLHIDDGDHYQAHTNYGKYLIDKGELSRAVEELTKAYKLHPDSGTKNNLEAARKNRKTIAGQKALEYQ